MSGALGRETGASGADHERGREEGATRADREREEGAMGDDPGFARARLEQALGHRFARRELFEAALRHSSFAHELERDGRPATDRPGLADNERLEFLGDAVLGVIVAHALYEAKPAWREGDLSRSLHALVERRSLERLARRIGVGPCLELGRTERQSGGEEKPTILADAMEALIGALYLDGGLEVAARFVRGAFGRALDVDAPRVARDPKTALQEHLMAEVGEFPTYRVVVDNGLEGDEARFTVEVLLQGEALARGVGRSKRVAERRAAETALEARTESAE